MILNRVEKNVIRQYNHLRYKAFPKVNSCDVTVFINDPKLLLQEECKKGKTSAPVAVKTKPDCVLMRDKKENSQ